MVCMRIIYNQRDLLLHVLVLLLTAVVAHKKKHTHTHTQTGDEINDDGVLEYEKLPMQNKQRVQDQPHHLISVNLL